MANLAASMIRDYFSGRKRQFTPTVSRGGALLVIIITFSLSFLSLPTCMSATTADEILLNIFIEDEHMFGGHSVRYVCICGTKYVTGTVEWDNLSEWERTRRLRQGIGLLLILALILIPIGALL